jgi:hypothetical protein
MDRRLETVGQRLETVDRRFDAMEERVKQLISDNMDRVDKRFDVLEKRIGERFDTVDRRIENVASRLDRVETNLNAVVMQTIGFNKSLADHDRLIQGALATQSAMHKAFDAMAKELREHRHTNGNGGTQKQ